MILAIGHAGRSIGMINKLIVSVITSTRIRGIGVPCGRMWVRDTFGLR